MVMKVFLGSMFVDGQQTACMMATTSRAKFSRVMGGKRNHGNIYLASYGNDLRLAEDAPEKMFVNKNRMEWPREWVRLK